MNYQEVSDENFSMLLRDLSCDILVKKVTFFCHCLKSLCRAKVKCFKLVISAEEISKQTNMDGYVTIDVNSSEDL